MNAPCRFQLRKGWLVLLMMLVCLFGCAMAAEEGTLNGTVLANGQPVAGAVAGLWTADTAAAQQTTGPDGSFSLSAPAGSYTFTLLPPENYAVTDLDGEAADTSGEFHSHVTLTAGEALSMRFVVSPAATLEGALPGGAGQTATLVSLYTSTAVTAQEDGRFTFTRLPAGNYSVYLPLPAGKRLEEGSPWQVTQQGDLLWLNVTLGTGDAQTLPAIALEDDMVFSGSAFVDSNGNAVLDPGEQCMTGVPVVLERMENGAWLAVAEATTDKYGAYSFSGLAAGEYRVVCTLGMQQYYASSVGGTCTVEDGRVCGGVVTQSAEIHVGLRGTTRLSVSAYEDANASGTRGTYEQPLPGVTVEALANGGVLSAGVTDAKGELSFIVPEGEVELRISMPFGYGITVPGAGQGSSMCVETFTAAADGSTAIEAAGQRLGSLSGRTFEDINNNGVMDEDEPGVPGVTVHLVGKKTGTTRDITTDDSGEYCFDLLPEDTYRITATLPEGMLYARYSTTGGDLRSIFSGATLDREFPVRKTNVTSKHIGVVQKGVIRGVAFLDANYNGVYDEGEPPYAGVTVEAIKLSNSESMGKAVTDETGAYEIANLRGGDYRVRVVLPSDGSIFTVTAEGDISQVNCFEQRSGRRDNAVEPVNILSGGEAVVIVGVARGATISGTVFQDANYNGRFDSNENTFSGVDVYAVDESGNVAASALSKAGGVYTLSGIMPGRYSVQVQRKPGHGFTRLRPDEKGGSHVARLVGELGVTEWMDIAMADTLTDVNAGMLPAATVGGSFFHDLNDDGLRGEDEIGMVTATVRLLSEDGEVDLTSAVDVNGSYFFDGVMPGSYTITYQLPEHCEMARVAQGGNTVAHAGLQTVTSRFDVVMGEAHTMPLAGAVTLGSFEGYAFHDANNNGLPDEGEARLSGAQLRLTPEGGEPYEVETGADGAFQFIGLRPGSYRMTVALPEGYILTDSLQSSGLTLSAVNEQTLACPWSVLTSRAQMAIGAVKPASIRGVIWLDENRNGSRSEDETILDGVVVELLDAATGVPVKRVTSTTEGFLFEHVRPAVYTVRITLPAQSSPAGEPFSSFTPSGGSLVSAGITVREGEVVDDLTAGLVSTTSLGGQVYLDVNGRRTAMAGVQVRLLMDGQSEVLQSAVTNAEGRYCFDGLWPADYRIEADMPEGALFVRPNDPNYKQGESIITRTENGTGLSEPITLLMARHQLHNNIILIRTARVGDLVWLDSNGNGLLDAGEPMIPGVTISLMQNGQAVYQTQSNAYGYYYFDQVYPGEYVLQATAYPELSPTTPVPALRIISSCLVDGDGASAHSEPFAVESGTSNLDYDLGYVLRDGQSLPSAIVPPPARDWTKSNTIQP